MTRDCVLVLDDDAVAREHRFGEATTTVRVRAVRANHHQVGACQQQSGGSGRVVKQIRYGTHSNVVGDHDSRESQLPRNPRGSPELVWAQDIDLAVIPCDHNQ